MQKRRTNLNASVNQIKHPSTGIPCTSHLLHKQSSSAEGGVHSNASSYQNSRPNIMVRKPPKCFPISSRLRNLQRKRPNAALLQRRAFTFLLKIALCNTLNDDGSCQKSGTLTCATGEYDQYQCSPPVSSSTDAILTRNDFTEGGDGGDRSQCDEQFHDNSELVVALSTGWFDNGSRCLKLITITAGNGRSVTAKVVDQCDSVHGCDKEHADQPPCRNNIVDGSQAVWDALGLDSGEERVTWSMA
ncbi:hypothetical protein JHK84_034562 [Glycine max]|nr:hypothetical protein JHK85_034936 [Glycine max]KAG4986602.1 hypothetical protein JHK86_034293 [Glycine max]KAG5140794.1 hypothetical protein JHK84_034562 [Glycine max]